MSQRRPLVCGDANRQLVVRIRALFDHLVGADHDRLWKRELESLGSFAIDRKCVARGLLDRQLAGLRALEYLVDVCGRAPEIIDKVGSIAHYAAKFGVFNKRTYGGNAVFERLRRELAQLLNKKDGTPFTAADEKRLSDFSNTLGVIVESWTQWDRAGVLRVPILARLGFSRLARTTPYVWDPRAQS